MKKKLKILLFPQIADQTIPMRTQTAEIFGNHLSKNHNIVSIMKSKSKNQYFIWKDIEIHNLSLYKFIKKILSILQNNEYDFIYLRDSFFLLLIAYIIKKRHNIPISIHIINPIKHMTASFHKWYHPKMLAGIIINTLQLKLLKRTDLVLPTSEWMGYYLISQGIDPKKIYNLPNGANLSLYESLIQDQDQKEYDFIYIGTMQRVRNLEILIRAMKLLCEKHKNSTLLMVGQGDDLTNLKKMAKDFNLERNIIFTGGVPYEEVPRYIAKAKAGISPIPPIYRYKVSSPLKIFEYWGCSLPVIANRGIPSHVKAICESQGGILVDYTPDSFAQGMLTLIENPKKIVEMAQNGINWVRKYRTYEKLALDFEKRIINDFF